MSLQDSMAEFASAALSRREFSPGKVPELAGNAFFGEEGTGAAYIADFSEALAAAGSDEVRTGRILTSIKAVDDSANIAPTGIFARAKKEIPDLAKGEIDFLVSYLKATRDADVDPNEKERTVHDINFVPPPPRDKKGGTAGRDAKVIPAKLEGWIELHDKFHALFVRYEAPNNERRVLLDIRALAKAQTDPELKVTAEKYVIARTITPRLIKDSDFLSHFGVPVDPDPPEVGKAPDISAWAKTSADVAVAATGAELHVICQRFAGTADFARVDTIARARLAELQKLPAPGP